MLENRNMQPQMMYHRSPDVHPYTGYYLYPPHPINYLENADDGGHVFNNESLESCAITLKKWARVYETMKEGGRIESEGM